MQIVAKPSVLCFQIQTRRAIPLLPTYIDPRFVLHVTTKLDLVYCYVRSKFQLRRPQCSANALTIMAVNHL